MALLIQNGRILSGSQDFVGDLLCEGEQIVALGPDLSAPAGAEVIDATGQYVFPGFIDPHVHIYLPFEDTFAKDDYVSASQAALLGGTTTLIEMCCPSRTDDPWQTYELWHSKARGISSCDYTFHMGVSRFTGDIEEQLRRVIATGIRSFKVFLAYKDTYGITDAELFATLRLAAELGVTVTAHCENETAIAELQKQFLAQGLTGTEYHERSRPPRVEADGVHHLVTFAELTGAEVYIVHTSCADALRVAERAQQRGLKASVEVVLPHLVLDKSYAERPNFEGGKYVMSPPLREREHQDVLWAALRSGLASTVATDHAPFDFVGQKDRGRDDFTLIPNGIPSIEHRVNLLYSRGVTTGRIDLSTFVDVASTNAAKLFGLYPRKGCLAVGSDADVVIYDPSYRGTLTATAQRMNVDYCAYEGMETLGRPTHVWVRGKAQVRDGEFVGSPGDGVFLGAAQP